MLGHLFNDNKRILLETLQPKVVEVKTNKRRAIIYIFIK